jgi:hypothetical protein
MILGAVHLYRGKLSGVDPQNGAGAQVLDEHSTMAVGEGVHLDLAAVHDDVDRRRTGSEQVGEIGAEARGEVRRF